MYVKGSASVNGNGLFVPKAVYSLYFYISSSWEHKVDYIDDIKNPGQPVLDRLKMRRTFNTGAKMIGRTQVCAIVAPIEMHFIHGGWLS